MIAAREKQEKTHQELKIQVDGHFHSLRKGPHLRCTNLRDSPGAQLCLACLRPDPMAKLNLRVQRLGPDVGHAVLGCNLKG